MRVVSWNIQYGVAVERAAQELRATAQLRAADLLLLQEMDEDGTARIAAALGAGYAFSSAAPHAHTGRDFGNAVVTPWPIRHRTELPLPHRSPVNGQPRRATHAVVSIGAVEVSCYSVHTEIPSLRLARRIEQFETVATDVRERGHEHVVVGGDFNTATRRGVRALAASMASVGLQRVPHHATYRRFGRDLALDHVFTTGFEVVAYGVVPVTAASDHLPVWIELRPAARPAGPTLERSPSGG